MSNTEQTYIMIKPDGVQRGLIGAILSRFEARGYKLVALKLARPSQAHLEAHYDDLKSKKFFVRIAASPFACCFSTKHSSRTRCFPQIAFPATPVVTSYPLVHVVLVHVVLVHVVLVHFVLVHVVLVHAFAHSRSLAPLRITNSLRSLHRSLYSFARSFLSLLTAGPHPVHAFGPCVLHGVGGA